LVAWLLGAGQWILLNIGPLVRSLLLGLAMALGISVLAHLLLLLPLWLIRQLLSHLLRMKIG
jgi:hypothetical protein